jgi:hypothetical protein
VISLTLSCASISSVQAWIPAVAVAPCNKLHYAPSRSTCTLLARLHKSDSDNSDVEMDALLDMDIVLFSRNESNEVELGAIQEDGTLAPLSAWTDEYAFDDSLEFVVDEEDRFPGLTSSDVCIIKVLDEHVIGYGSRQVGGGMGPGNPHGEESELCYYVDQSVLKDVNVVIKPELEIFW